LKEPPRYDLEVRTPQVSGGAYRGRRQNIVSLFIGVLGHSSARSVYFFMALQPSIERTGFLFDQRQ
jgi:hypothetical protein